MNQIQEDHSKKSIRKKKKRVSFVVCILHLDHQELGYRLF